MNLAFLETRLNRLSQGKRQWVWFVLLWLSGLVTLASISMVIKWAMGV